MRRAFIAGNWKMYKTSAEAVAFARAFVPLTAAATDRDIMLAPAYPALEALAGALQGSSVAVGAQDLFWEAEGAFTGQVSARMIAASGCRHVIIGHSERRQYFGETDASVNRKIRAALKEGLVPLLCIGESEAERDAGKTLSILDKQVMDGLEGIFAKELSALVIAYEPVWAIGTGKTATAQQAEEAHRFIRKRMGELFGAELAEELRVLYGGSVKPQNISELMAMPDIDGALVGGASLDPQTFSQIVNFR